MCDLSVMELTAGITAIVLWITVLSFAAFVNVSCWVAIKWLLTKGD